MYNPRSDSELRDGDVCLGLRDCCVGDKAEMTMTIYVVSNRNAPDKLPPDKPNALSASCLEKPISCTKNSVTTGQTRIGREMY